MYKTMDTFLPDALYPDLPYTKKNHVLILHLKMLTNYLKENYTYAFFFTRNENLQLLTVYVFLKWKTKRERLVRQNLFQTDHYH